MKKESRGQKDSKIEKNRAESPFIIYSKNSLEEVRKCVIENQGRIRYELPFINALCVDLPGNKCDEIRSHSEVAEMSKDVDVSKLPVGGGDIFNMSVEGEALSGQFGRDEDLSEQPGRDEDISGLSVGGTVKKNRAVSKRGIFKRARLEVPGTGEGVTIAIIDTGFAPHYDILKPSNRLLYFKDFKNGRNFPYDDDGHGTHVTGIAAGNGYAAGRYAAGKTRRFRMKGAQKNTQKDTEKIGTAPACNLVVLKALDEKGNGSAFDILAAMQWISDNHKKYNIRVVNLSLGVPPNEESPIDPLVLGANALISQGISVVVAAGNSGPDKSTITSPGTSPLVITVGSSHHDRVAAFSSRGPTPSGKHKPDLVAPGVDIVSLNAENCKGYIVQSGTSMSCPYVAGIVADLYSLKPNLTPHQIKRILLANTVPLRKEPADAQGAGLVLF